MKKALWLYVPVVAGLGFMATALLARNLGLDHNAGWGVGRWFLLGSGALVSVISFLSQYREKVAAALPQSVRGGLTGWARNGPLRNLWNHRVGAITCFAVLGALALYLFFVTAGTWTEWPESSRYYDDLATALRAGHLYLGVRPTAAFLALSNPYDPAARNSSAEVRAFVDEVYDLSFFQGKFYLYWGPAPAALLSIVKLLYAGPIADQYLVFGFLAGLLILTVLLLLEIWGGLFDDVPFLLALIGIITAALVCPTLWMLSSAGIYEATIAGGQFFSMAGLYFAYTALKEQPASRTRLVVAVISWAFAGASRTLIVVPAAFLTLMVVVWCATNGGTTKPVPKTIMPSLIMALPLTCAILALGWYNWARFGSVLETGGRYTLTLHNLTQPDAAEFSTSYVLPSLWIYMLNPFESQSRFPFVVPAIGKIPSFLYLRELNNYHTEEVSGLLYVAPFVLFSIVAIANTLSLASRTYVRRVAPKRDGRQQRLLWISICLIGSVILPLSVVLLHYDLRMRFLSEFVPSLMLLSSLGLWQGYRLARRKAVSRYLYVAGACAIALVGVSTGVLLTIGGHYSWFRHYNPHLLKQLTLFFSR